jgi:hypothetical protein
MVGADDEIVWPLTSKITAGLTSKDKDDTHEDTTALFGIDVGSGSAAPIDLDSSGGEGVTMTGTPVCSNGLSPSVAGTGTSSGPGVGKRKSAMWADFDEIYETVNGRQISTKVTCKMCKHTLSARSNAGTRRFKRYQKSCRQKTDQAARVQSRLAYNPDGFVHN